MSEVPQVPRAHHRFDPHIVSLPELDASGLHRSAQSFGSDMGTRSGSFADYSERSRPRGKYREGSIRQVVRGYTRALLGYANGLM
ncbi:hypothetical protein ACFLY9_01100 [Patescibacteria group bacterium]